jgi:hypothetical protein
MVERLGAGSRADLEGVTFAKFLIGAQLRGLARELER